MTPAELMDCGLSLIPIAIDKRPVIPSWKPYQDRRATDQEITEWLALNPPAWANVTGEVSHRISLDFDGEAGAETMRRLGINPHRRTPSGYHADFEHPGWPVKTLNGKSKRLLAERYPGLDIRADGGYAIVQGRNSKGKYEWLRDPEPYPLSTMPNEVRDFLGLLNPPKGGQTAKPKPSGTTNTLGSVPLDLLISRAVDKVRNGEGRNNAGFWLALQCRDEVYDRTDATAALSTFRDRVPTTNTKGESEAYSDAEINATVEQAFSRLAREPWGATRRYQQNGVAIPSGSLDEPKPSESVLQVPSLLNPPLTDLGNAERLVMLHGENLRYCYRLARWFVWSGKRWEVDDGERVEQLASETVRQLYAEAASIDDSDRRKAVAGWARKSESERSLKAAVSLARSRPGISVKPDDLDRDPWLLNCQNGTLDLKSGYLRAHERADLITKVCAAEYDRQAQAPIFEAFLNRIFGGSERLIRFVQRSMGYGLTGDTSEQVAFIWWGGGSNGKSTFLNACLDLLADYALSTPSETLLLKHGDNIPNDVARLKGARFVAATETEEGRRLAESKLKAMTGQDRISARFMRAEWFDFQPTFKLFLATNPKPEIRGTDWAIWRRIRLVPFTVTIPDDEQDKALPEKLRAELPGILEWGFRGCLDWQRDGLNPPDEVITATNEYRNESDQLGRFIDEMCVTGDGFQARARPLYLEYRKWAESAGEAVLTETAFGRRLVERGFTKQKRGSVVYDGIGLRAEPG